MTTDGATILSDGTHSITARRVLADGTQTPESPASQILIDTSAPIVSAIATSAVTGGQTAGSFIATWVDNTAMNAASVAGAFLVSGPGISTLATLASVTPSGNASTLTATYTFVAPGGSWDVSDNVMFARGVRDGCHSRLRGIDAHYKSLERARGKERERLKSIGGG